MPIDSVFIDRYPIRHKYKPDYGFPVTVTMSNGAKITEKITYSYCGKCGRKLPDGFRQLHGFCKRCEDYDGTIQIDSRVNK